MSDCILFERTPAYSNDATGRTIVCAAHAEWVRRWWSTGWDKRGYTTTATDGPCVICAAEAEKDEHANTTVRAALLLPALAHTRFRNGSVYVYHRDDTSPTGVVLSCSTDAERFDKLFIELTKSGQLPRWASPLSPTEGMQGAR